MGPELAFAPGRQRVAALGAVALGVPTQHLGDRVGRRPNAWERGRVSGRAAVRDSWTRQWAAIDPKVKPRAFTKLPDGRVDALVHQIARSLDGTLLTEGMIHHTYAFRGAATAGMDVGS